jgi:perosamine synthetase
MADLEPDFTRFAIGFDQRDRARLHELWDGVLDTHQWTEGELVRRFEAAWSEWNGLPSVAFGNWAGGALAALEFADVRGRAVLCPSNTFMAVPLAILKAGGRPVFVDCRRDDLCMSFEHFEEQADRHDPAAVVVVHIGGHIAFDVEAIAGWCAAQDVFLLEDCAHAHGARWNERRPGTWGDCGVYSCYATKTISTAEGGMLVSRQADLVAFAQAYRNYGKPEYAVEGLSHRMSEFTAALGILGVERLEEIVAWKNAVAREHLDAQYRARLELPDGMVSGLYKYIVFEPVQRSTGKVYDEPCHRIMGEAIDLPNTDWVATHHACPPLYYRGPEMPAPAAEGASVARGSAP